MHFVSERAGRRTRPARIGRFHKDLRCSLIDGAAFSLMVGLGETYLPAFVLALGNGEVLAGLTSSVPMLLGALLQMISPRAVKRLGSHRRWVVCCAALQAAVFVPLAIGAAYGRIPVPFVFVCAALYWAGGLGAGPAWNTWVETLVPRRIRPRFFAQRTIFAQSAVLTGLLLGGAMLHYGDHHRQPLVAFAVVFALAAVARFASSAFLAAQSEPIPMPNGHRTLRPRELLSRMHNGGAERQLLYLLAVQVAVQISGPFFTPYMFRQLHFSYLEYVALTASAFVAKILALPVLGFLAQRFGTQSLLWLGGIGIIPLPALWLISNSFGFLLAIQIAGGAAWAAFELAMLLSFFERVQHHERTSVLTMFNFANAAAMALGSFIGGVTLAIFHDGVVGYLSIFAMSALGRTVALALFWRERTIRLIRRPFGLRVVAVRPTDGSIDRPILPSLAGDDSRAA